MSDIKTTEANDELKKQDVEDKELTPDDLNQVSAGHNPPQGLNGANHNQTCTFIG